MAKAIKPDYALGNHVAALGLAYSGGTTLPAPFGQGMFIGQHGSWNRKPRSGYNVVFEVLSGFVSPDGDAWGRPVGVALDKRGALLVADDVGNIIWRVTATGAR